MTHSNDELDAALERVLAGEATPEERALVERRAITDPRLARLLASLRTEFSASADVWNTDAAWARMQARIHSVNSSGAQTRDILSSRSKRQSTSPAATRVSLVGIAASVLLVLGASLVWRTASHRSHASAPTRVIATARGHRSTFLLADGSRVMLDVDSRMQVDVSRTDGSRDVYLTGEAFFQVRHDANRPFNVHAAGAVTRVLGTEFDVRAYPGARSVYVAVRSGAVSLGSDRAGAAGVLLTRGELGSIDSRGTATVHAGANAESMLGWTTGNLIVADVTVREAAEQLARWYDARIVVDDATLAGRKITATFRDEPLTQALDAISLSLRARVTRAGDTFHITAGRGAQ